MLGGQLYAGPYPGALEAELAARKLRAFADLGVSHFVDLTEEGESGRRGLLEPYAHLLDATTGAHGVPPARHTRMPIRDLGVPSVAQMEKTLELIESSLEAGETVYFHCWGGVGRTGTVLGCLLIGRGVAREEVFDTIAEMRSETARAHRPAPETSEQRDFVLSWQPRKGT